MDKIKFIVFVEFLTLLVILVAHLAYSIVGVDFNLYNYPIVMSIVLLASLFSVYVITPIADWFFKL